MYRLNLFYDLSLETQLQSIIKKSCRRILLSYPPFIKYQVRIISLSVIDTRFFYPFRFSSLSPVEMDKLHEIIRPNVYSIIDINTSRHKALCQNDHEHDCACLSNIEIEYKIFLVAEIK